MKRWKVSVIGGFVLCFFLFFYLFISDSNGKKRYELDEVESLESINEVDQFFYDKTPGLKRAEEKGLVTELDQTIPLDYPKGFLHLDKMWHTPNGTYLFYNRDISSIGEDEDGSVMPSILDVSFRELAKNEIYRKLISYNQGMRPSDGAQFEGRYYHRIKLDPLKHDDVKDSFEIKTFPVTITLNIDGVKSYINKTELPIGFDRSKEEFRSYDINQSVDLSPLEAKLHVGQIKMGYYSTKLYYDIDIKSPEKVKHVDLRVMSDGESIGGVHSTERSLSDTNASFIKTSEPFSKIPNDIEILVRKVEMNSDKSISFSIDTSDITEESSLIEEKINKKLNHFVNTDIYYESFRYDPEGEFFVTVKYVTPKSEKPFVQLTNEVPKPLFYEDRRRPAMYVEAYNQEGENVIGGGGYGGPQGLEREFGFEIGKDYVEKSDEIDVLINHLPYELVLDKKLEISLEK